MFKVITRRKEDNMSFLEILLMLTAVILIILSLLQSGKSDGLGLSLIHI